MRYSRFTGSNPALLPGVASPTGPWFVKIPTGPSGPRRGFSSEQQGLSTGFGSINSARVRFGS